MLSTPPAIYRSPSPQVMAREASTTACRPLAQSRLTVQPGVVGGRPPSSAAKRATLRLSSPAWLTQPSTTSAISEGSILLRATTSLITSPARSSGRSGASLPAWRPMGLRSPSYRYASSISVLRCQKGCAQLRAPPQPRARPVARLLVELVHVLQHVEDSFPAERIAHRVRPHW